MTDIIFSPLFYNSFDRVSGAIRDQTSAIQDQTSAAIAAAIIAAGGRPVSPNEAVTLLRDLKMLLHPQSGNGRYEAWKKTFNGDEVFR